MMSYITVAAFLAALIAYYLIVWHRAGRDPAQGTIVTRYEPPKDLSPALMRFVWKQGFDERTFWAAVLSLVARGLIVLEDSGDQIFARRIQKKEKGIRLPVEEASLLRRITYKAVNISQEFAFGPPAEMVGLLRQAALGKFFLENRKYVAVGAVLSLFPLVAIARPVFLDELYVLILGIAVMIPGFFYLSFSANRLRDLLRFTPSQRGWLRSWFVLLFVVVSSSAGIFLGLTVLHYSFGLPMLVTLAGVFIINATFFRLMRAPTATGRKLMDEIEGFRHFLASVERLPFDREQAPAVTPGLYERYLPYAVALEVEQAWADRAVAVMTAYGGFDSHASHSFSLTLWGGEALTVAMPDHSEQA